MKRLVIAAALLGFLFGGQAHAADLSGPAYLGVATGALPSSGILSGTLATSAAGTGYAPGDTVTLTCPGCTASTAPIAVVLDGQAVSATVSAAGSGGSNGACTVTDNSNTSGVTYTTRAQFTGTVSGGALTGPLTIAVPGDYYFAIPTNPIAVTGCSLAGATITVAYGVLGAQATTLGVFTAAPAISPTLTQSATSGGGTGAQFSGSLGPLASSISSQSLLTGGGTATGNYFSGAEQFNGIVGNELTFVGDRAGSGIKFGNATTAIGHNAAGNSGGAGGTAGTAASPVSFSVFIGNDSGRNITGNPINDTCIGQSSCRVMSGTGNTGMGQNVLAAATGNNNTVVGAFAGALLANSGTNAIFGVQTGNKITNGANRNLLLGPNVATTTLATGSDNVLIGTSASIDTAGAATSNTIQIGAGSTAVWSATGGGTPSTAVSTINGTLVLPNAATGTPTASLCLDSSNNIIKKTTTGACI